MAPRQHSTRPFFPLGLWAFLVSLLPAAAHGLTIQTPADASYLETLAAQELRRLIYQRTGERLETVASDILPAEGELILVADQSDPFVGTLVDHASGDGGFFLKTVENSGRQILVVSGKGGEETLAAAYRFAEKPVSEGGLGIFFGLAEEVVPSVPLPDFSLPTGLDEAAEPLFATRGLNPWHDFPSGPDLWGTEEYLALISQLPKVGMNFIGLHTYPRYNEYYHYENQTFDRGPEPTVWIGLPGDYDADGQVTWSYPAYYAHSRRPNLIWGMAEYETGRYHGGTRELFPTDGWGSEVIGETPPAPGDLTASNAVFNRAGHLFNTAFTHAQRIGVKTALGTELPLGEAVTDDGETWVRAMPRELQDRLVQAGKTPSDPAVVKEVYKGIFDRIQKTHPLDYFWLWSWEVWPGKTTASREAMEADIALAREALAELGNPFTLGFAGWKLGAANEEPGNDADDDPTVFNDDFALSSPFFSLLGTAIGFDQLPADRVKWASTFLEYDAFLGLPELSLTRIHEDAVAAVQQGADGFIAKHWRTRLMSPNVAAMKELMWSFGTTGTDPATWTKPTDQTAGPFIDAFYLRWARHLFGEHANTQAIADLFIDLESQFAAGTIPKPLDWTDDATDDIAGRPSLFDGGTAPAKIRRNPADWDEEKARYAFVDEFAALRPTVTGAAERERFDYWLRAFQAWKRKGEYGCVLDDFENAMAAVRVALAAGDDASAQGQAALALREQLATLFAEIMALEAGKVVNASDLGDIMNLEVVNWKQLMETKHDADLLAALGGAELPASASPGQEYTAPPFVQVTSARTQVEPGEDLALTLLAPGVSTTPAVSVRPLGSTAGWTEITASPVGRSVYEAAIPAQPGDFEYRVEAGEEVYPANAPQAVATVVVAGAPGSGSTDPSSPSPTPPTREILTTGVAEVGATLAVDPGLVLDTNETTVFSYQWRRGGSPIAGATGPSYSVTAADLGASLSVAITYSDLAGHPQETITSFPGVVQAAASAHTFFVAPTGNDSNDGSAASPWRTLDGARQNVRPYLDGSGHLTVQFETGHYALSSTVVFSPADSGTADQVVTYRAAEGATPVFSSLQEVTGWTPDPSHPALSVAPLPPGVGPVRFLYSSRSDWMPRSATEEFTTTEAAGSPGQVENTTDLLDRQDERSNFRYPDDFAFPDPSRISQYDLRQSIIGWHMEILPLTGIDTAERRAFTAVPGCYELREDTTEPRPAGFWILNSFEGLDSPGEWAVLDGFLYLYGRDPAARLFVPTLTELVRVDDGTNGRDDPVTAPVSHLRFEGLTFTGGDFYAMQDTRGPSLADRRKEITIQHDWAVVDKPTGLLRLRNTADIEVRGCTFTKSGGSGLRVDRYGQDLRIVDNEFSHLGRTGLSLIGRGPGYGNVNHGNVIAGNTFAATGQEKWAAPALVLDQTTSNLVKHNAFLDTAFTAITVTGPRQMGILSKAEKLDAAVDNPATALDYDGREFHYYGMAPSFEAFLSSTEEYVLDPAKAALDAMQFVYNYDNYIEENLFLDVGDGADRFFNGKAAYLSGGTRDPDPAVVRKNYFRYNYIHDTHPQSYADYAWYNDYDQDGAEMSGNILTNLASPGMPLVLATSGYAEGGLGREPVSVQANLVLGSTDNGTFVADGNDQGVAGIELQGNLVGGAGGSSANLGDYERMLAFVQRGAAGSTPLPVSGAVSAALTETIASFGGTVPAPAGTPSFGRIVSFGDSLSDRGNNGIASDGDTTWVDALSGYLGLGRSIPSLMGGFNYAYGGAVTGFPDDDSEPPSAAAQVQAFFAEHGGFNTDDLVTLWIGGNDFLENPLSPLAAETLKQRYTTILQGLVDLGATTILWPYVPDYGLLPDFQEEAATAYAASVNAAIDEVRAAMLAQKENLRIVLFDFPALQAELEQDFAEYQLAEPPSTPTPDGADPSVLAARFLLSDGVHPTTTGHEIIAAEALRSLQSSLVASGTAVQLGIRTARDPLDSGLLQVFLEAKGNGRHLLQRSTDLQNWTTLTPVEIVQGAHTTHRKESETPVFYRLATP